MPYAELALPLQLLAASLLLTLALSSRSASLLFSLALGLSGLALWWAPQPEIALYSLTAVLLGNSVFQWIQLTAPEPALAEVN